MAKGNRDGSDSTEREVIDQEPEVVHHRVADNAALVDSVLARRRESFLRHVFPREEDRVVRAHELEEIRTGFEFRRRALHMAVDSRLQAIEELCNDVLVTGKSEIRRRRQEFFAEQKLRLELAMNACAERFNQEIERRLEELERYRNETLRDREERRLLRTVDQFHEMLEQLGGEFLAIIQEGVSR